MSCSSYNKALEVMGTSDENIIVGEGEGYLFNSSLPLSPALPTLRHQPGNYCSELTYQQPDSNREPLVFKRKSLTFNLCVTNLRALVTKFTGKHLCQSLFATLLKKRLWHRCFTVNFEKFLRTSFLSELLRWLLP